MASKALMVANISLRKSNQSVQKCPRCGAEGLITIGNEDGYEIRCEQCGYYDED